MVDKFRRLAAAGEELTLDDGGRATIGVVHVEDAARIAARVAALAARGSTNVVAETMTVADVAALASRRRAAGAPRARFSSPFEYAHRLADYL